MTTHSESNVVLDLGQAILKLKEEKKLKLEKMFQFKRSELDSALSDQMLFFMKLLMHK